MRRFWEYNKWQVIDHKFVKEIANLPIQCKKKYAIFKEIIEINGINYLNEYPGFKLEILKGNFHGKYSIRLNLYYRVIYELDIDKKEIVIVEISKHKYGK